MIPSIDSFRGAEVTLRRPQPTDGLAVHNLIAQCPPLDNNSIYCNLLQCTHFSHTSVLAVTSSGDALGFISGYRVPTQPEALFIWQVAVAQSARRTGLGSRMLRFLTDADSDVTTRLLTSINPDNSASRALFSAFAGECGATIREFDWFSSAAHFGSSHPDETLLDIGPLDFKRHSQAATPVHSLRHINRGRKS